MPSENREQRERRSQKMAVKPESRRKFWEGTLKKINVIIIILDRDKDDIPSGCRAKDLFPVPAHSSLETCPPYALEVLDASPCQKKGPLKSTEVKTSLQCHVMRGSSWWCQILDQKVL